MDVEGKPPFLQKISLEPWSQIPETLDLGTEKGRMASFSYAPIRNPHALCHHIRFST